MMNNAQPVAYIRRSVASKSDPGDISREFQTDAVRKLADELGVPKGLAELGVTDDMVPRLARTTLKDACLATNPREADARDIEALFRAAL